MIALLEYKSKLDLFSNISFDNVWSFQIDSIIIVINLDYKFNNILSL